MDIKLPSGYYWYYADVQTPIKVKTAIMVALPAMFARISVLGGLIIKGANSWQG